MTTFLSLAILLLVGAQILHLIQHVMEDRRRARAITEAAARGLSPNAQRHFTAAVNRQMDSVRRLEERLDWLEAFRDAYSRGAKEGIHKNREARGDADPGQSGGAAWSTTSARGLDPTSFVAEHRPHEGRPVGRVIKDELDGPRCRNPQKGRLGIFFKDKEVPAPGSESGKHLLSDFREFDVVFETHARGCSVGSRNCAVGHDGSPSSMGGTSKVRRGGPLRWLAALFGGAK